ncbi:MAG: AI-2E family transporter [Candidatus Eremiobacteraeota bacterium]|uniref:AI-2E family transporter n=1 Tax=mine drainage metagenome TaxID=410659 RepID=E6PIX1_9ZZZZ|nr:AI-2E family transporter [Candidatus Eremiobacteraeota bacterium]
MDARTTRLAAVGAGFLLAVLLAWLLRPVLLAIVPALLYALLTWPLVRRLRRVLPNLLAVILANAALAVVVGSAVLLFGPMLYGQARALFATMPDAARAALLQLPSGMREELGALVGPNASTLLDWSRTILSASFAVLRSTTAMIAALVLAPVLAAYLQLDAPRYGGSILSIFPSEQRDGIRAMLAQMYDVVDGFVRAQMLVSALVGLLVFLVLHILGIRFALSIAIFTAAFDLVPYLGGIAAFVPSMLLALAAGGVAKALLVTALLAIVFAIEAYLLSPTIVGTRTRLPTSAVVLALLVGGELFGPLGLYLAVPVAAMLRIALRYARG